MKGGQDMKKRGEKLLRLTELFDVPGEAALGVPRVTVTGGHKVHIENHRGLLEYETDRITVNAAGLLVRVRGDGLEISAMSDMELVVTGSIISVELVR